MGRQKVKQRKAKKAKTLYAPPDRIHGAMERRTNKQQQVETDEKARKEGAT